jgi:hypothetical protein
MNTTYAHILLDALQELNEELPELIDSSNLETLVWRVYAAQGRTERHHLQVRILLQEQAALQASVDGTHLRLLTKESAVALNALGQELRLWVRCPTWIAIRVLYVEAGKIEY